MTRAVACTLQIECIACGSGGHIKMEQQMLMTADELSAEVARCVDRCESCHRLCLTALMGRCLDDYCDGTDPHQLRMMLACAYLCRTTADLMLTLPAPLDTVCAACAQLCWECARGCPNPDLQELVTSCMECAESCNRLAGVHAQPVVHGGR